MASDSVFKLTEKQELQRDLAAGSARHVLAFGGSRSGKTFGFMRCVSTRALMAPGSRHLVCRLHNIDVRQSVMMDTFPSMMKMCYPGVDYEVNKADQFATYENGAEIWFGGLDDKERIEKILGKEYVTIYPNECSQIAYATIMTLRTRLAQKCVKNNGEPLPLKAYYDLNPVGQKHWSYQEFVLGVNPIDKRKFPAGSRVHLQMNPVDNPNLPEEYLEELESLPKSYRDRFKDGTYASDVPGALWPTALFDKKRVTEYPDLVRIAVAVDPSGGDGNGNDSQGIIVAGIDADSNCYVLEDATCNLSPAGWGQRVIDCYNKWQADLIVAEINYGGAMVESNIKAIDPTAKVEVVTASRGKHVRAEPVAALYEAQNRTVYHVGEFPELEEQLSMFTNHGYQGSGSPDRADALVWAIIKLALNGIQSLPGILLKNKYKHLGVVA